MILETLGRFYAPTLQCAALLDGEINEQRLQRVGKGLRDTRGSIIVKPHIVKWTEWRAAFVGLLYYIGVISRHQDYIQSAKVDSGLVKFQLFRISVFTVCPPYSLRNDGQLSTKLYILLLTLRRSPDCGKLWLNKYRIVWNGPGPGRYQIMWLAAITYMSHLRVHKEASAASGIAVALHFCSYVCSLPSVTRLGMPSTSLSISVLPLINLQSSQRIGHR